MVIRRAHRPMSFDSRGSHGDHQRTVVRAWKDEEYRDGLPAEVRRAIPPKPVQEGGGELSDAELESAAGGFWPIAGAVAAGAGVIIGAGASYGSSLEGSGDTCDPSE